MTTYHRMRQYQEQAITSATPEQLVLKLYDLAVTACHTQDRAKLRAVLVELISGLNFDEGGDIAGRLLSLYQYCLTESGSGDLNGICNILTGLREAWRQGVATRRAA